MHRWAQKLRIKCIFFRSGSDEEWTLKESLLENLCRLEDDGELKEETKEKKTKDESKELEKVRIGKELRKRAMETLSETQGKTQDIVRLVARQNVGYGSGDLAMGRSGYRKRQYFFPAYTELCGDQWSIVFYPSSYCALKKGRVKHDQPLITAQLCISV